ncbi:MAG: DUF418 domain-containing protein [Paludibacter sp.]|nr:DUF418 domain-containing protein [Paludibacter sp.]
MSEYTSPRLHVVDALRGFAILSIMLLHNIEHFDFYFKPTTLPAWMPAIDKGIWDTLFFLFGGKSYAIFALLFGLTFFIQSNNQEQKGKDFRLRFAWRLLLLLGFGIINSAFYEGDILTIYALIGFTLIPVARLSNRVVFIIAIILMLQPWEWLNVLSGLQHPGLKMANPASWAYFDKLSSYIPGDSLVKTWIGNLTNGKPAVLFWTWEAGRVFQTAALFMFGMLAGRTKLFVQSVSGNRFWVRTLLIAILAFIPLFLLKNNLPLWIQSEAIRRPLVTIITSWSNMAFMLMLVSGFVLAYWKLSGGFLNILTPFGKMSLSNYMMQSILGSVIYYGFGFGLYKYTGALYCLFIGLALATFQWFFCNWWLKTHKYGPLEGIWHRLTWIRS